jgi:hypothetical protein
MSFSTALETCSFVLKVHRESILKARIMLDGILERLELSPSSRQRLQPHWCLALED